MPDVFTPAKRSDVMSRIRSRGNRDTELAVAKLFRSLGITGWRRQVPLRVERRASSVEGSGRSGSAPGPVKPRPAKLNPHLTVRPDFVFPKRRVAVFVDGCFWHGCPRHATQPAHRRAFWRRKLEGNRARDRLVTRVLRRGGWRVLRIWEHELAPRNRVRLERRLQRWL